MCARARSPYSLYVSEVSFLHDMLILVLCAFYQCTAQSRSTESTYIQTQLRLDRINLLSFVARFRLADIFHICMYQREHCSKTIDFIATCNKCRTTHIFCLVLASCLGNRNLIIAVHLESYTPNRSRESQE